MPVDRYKTYRACDTKGFKTVNVVLATAGLIVGSILVAFVWHEGKVVSVGEGNGMSGCVDPERQPLIREERGEM